MTNLDKAILILEQLAYCGVRTICLCPGARNGVFISLLSKGRGFEIISFYDERSAGFFALGRSRRDQRPVAVLTTSGTAVSELLSPVIEAYHSDVSLVVVSSDRPKRLRGTGAPQTIDQSGIFKGYVEKSWDMENCDDFHLQASLKKPVHINVCFDEPLLDKETPSITFCPKEVYNSDRFEISDLKKIIFNRCLVVVGGLKESQRPAISASLLNLKVPFFLESLSGLRHRGDLFEKRIFSEKIVCQMICSGAVKSVLRLGDVPLGRYWRDLDQLNIPVLSISDKNFSGTDKSQIYVHSLLSNPLTSIGTPPWDWSDWKRKDRVFYNSVMENTKKFPFSEAGFIFKMIKKIPKDHVVYIGNSLPIRLWDLLDQDHFKIFANRGVNGIDGQVSTAFGLCDFKNPMWIILGDLTTLYDFSGFWLTSYLIEKKAMMNLIVINNHGGKIFSRLFQNPLFYNEHKMDFEKFALFWDWSYEKIEKKTGFNQALGFGHFPVDFEGSSGKLKKSNRRSFNFYELCIDSAEDESFWEEYDRL